MTFARLIRSAVMAWDRWRWKCQKRAPRSILKMQEQLQRERRAHKATRATLAKIKTARHEAMKMELGR